MNVADGEEVYDPVLYRLMTFPLVTIAAVNGHGESTLGILGEKC